MTQMQSGIVYIVDDDRRICEALGELLSAIGVSSKAFHSISDYLEHRRSDEPSCLVLDVNLPDINGLEFQEQAGDGHPPIIFITGHGDIRSSVRAMKAGAVNYLTKPFDASELLASIAAAITQDRAARRDRQELAVMRGCYANLTAREREILPLVVSGLRTRQAAAELGISEVTMQIHRGRIMQKMQATSLADLVRVAYELGIPVRHTHRRDDRAQ
ncbi:response regulator transcription factor [Neoroseomonas lacus]|uniref:DNA-binding response regulator n=1 Tax=Neoroseomonas lacus TaxID=287609 RepID=A0A917KBY6_9PROT|nr:response regulator [Neoroseomonas lacus]GGJ04826.1 DNA-binding response regulator [Neoroseomonas lacus]